MVFAVREVLYIMFSLVVVMTGLRTRCCRVGSYIGRMTYHEQTLHPTSWSEYESAARQNTRTEFTLPGYQAARVQLHRYVGNSIGMHASSPERLVVAAIICLRHMGDMQTASNVRMASWSRPIFRVHNFPSIYSNYRVD